jgi:biopolymer transport protein ExbD
MRIESRQDFSSTPDMTPMLDCCFQLTFFFMLTLNFSSDIQSELIHLPTSEIAKPPERAMETPITVQTMASGMVLFGGDKMTAGALRGPLQREKNMLGSVLGRDMKNATVIIRADRDVPVGKVQEVIQVCQSVGFEKFVLRARVKFR